VGWWWWKPDLNLSIALRDVLFGLPDSTLLSE